MSLQHEVGTLGELAKFVESPAVRSIEPAEIGDVGWAVPFLPLVAKSLGVGVPERPVHSLDSRAGEIQVPPRLEQLVVNGRVQTRTAVQIAAEGPSRRHGPASGHMTYRIR